VLIRVLIAALVVLAGGAAGAGLLDGDPAAGALEGRVVKVVDGDTIHVALRDGREKVRYIGVDTPETQHPAKGVECYGPAASAYNRRLVAGRRVRLVVDVERRDRYGRLLAYVVRAGDGLQVNAQLARDGYARPLSIPPNTRFAARFARLAAEARSAGRGLWAACR
jgi:micrococcal nuclease